MAVYSKPFLRNSKVESSLENHTHIVQAWDETAAVGFPCTAAKSFVAE